MTLGNKLRGKTEKARVEILDRLNKYFIDKIVPEMVSASEKGESEIVISSGRNDNIYINGDKIIDWIKANEKYIYKLAEKHGLCYFNSDDKKFIFSW